MASPTFAFYLTALVMTMDNKAAVTKMSLLLESGEVGNSRALQCLCRDETAVMFFWYKQTLGKEPRLVCTIYKQNNIAIFRGEFNSSRFSADSKTQNVLLTMTDLRMSDSATYYCVKSNLVEFEFCEGTKLTVKGLRLISSNLHHKSETEPILSRGSVTPNCSVQTGSCGSKHRFYWFQDSENSNPGLIYSQGCNDDQFERKLNNSTNICDFNLPTENLNKPHAGTYFCAVASCGHVMFRKRTIVHSEGGGVAIVWAYLLSGALTFSSLLFIFLVFSVNSLSRITTS